MATKDQVRAGLEIVLAMGEAIKELGEVPAGQLYAVVSGKLSLGDFESAIGILKRTGLITETGHLLKWVGPNKG